MMFLLAWRSKINERDVGNAQGSSVGRRSFLAWSGARRDARLCIRAPRECGGPGRDDRCTKAGAKGATLDAGTKSQFRPANAARRDHDQRAGAVQSDSSINRSADQRSETEGARADSRDPDSG